ncbi:MAG: UpxY family transcription antiterminator [Rikenellaceae bacterium]
MVDYSDKGTVWYAMQTTYKRELKAKSFLDSLGIENFIPMMQSITRVVGKKKVVVKPAIHNLIFVKAELTLLNHIKSRLNFIHNILIENNGRLSPIIVPERQMEQFINVVRTSLDKVIYVDLSLARLEKGTKVKITAGQFEGYEGVLMKVKGARDKRVVLNIECVVAIAIVSIDAELIEKIEN